MTITVELTEEQIEHLLNGAREHGRCSTYVQAATGQGIILVVANHDRRRNRAAKARQEQPDAGGA